MLLFSLICVEPEIHSKNNNWMEAIQDNKSEPDLPET